MLDKLIQQMTLKEKVGQLNQRLYGWQTYEKTKNGIQLTDYFKEEVQRWDSLGVIYGVFRSDPWSEKNLETGLNQEEAKQVSEMIQAYIKEQTRLKIPVLLTEECPHGHQGLDSLTTPTNYAVGASWNPALYQELQGIVAEELREKGAHVGLISTLDLCRDPRWGRTEECFSEDPYLASAFTKAAVVGLQGEKSEQVIAKQKVLATLKHFAAQGDAMGGHNAGPVPIGERELKELHLPMMQAGIDAGALLCMAAYNDIDGVPCHINEKLLTNTLRTEMGFTGAVMADGCALDRVAERTGKTTAASLALQSGVDISLWDNVYPNLEEAVLSGQLDEKLLDQAVYRVLTLKEKLGLFTEEEEETKPVHATGAKEKAALNRQMAEESMVLLKNEGILPLTKKAQTNVALIGPHIENIYHQLGDYTPFKNLDDCITLAQGIETACKENEMTYASTLGSFISAPLENGLVNACTLAEKSDVVIVTLGGSSARDFSTEFDANGAALAGSNEMTSGENIDLADLAIPKAQMDLLKALHQTGKPIVAVVISGRPHLLKACLPYVDALLLAGYPGQHGGQALANLLFGKSNPSGKLAISIPDENGQLPVFYNYRAAAFKEDYLDLSGRPIFSFGAGLSYTTFALEEVQLQKTTQGWAVSGQLLNTGAYDGAEVVQIYMKNYSTVVLPRAKKLCGFEKCFVKKGEMVSFTIPIEGQVLQDFDLNMQPTTVTAFDLSVEIHQQQVALSSRE
ncbi:MAG: glycoside hydrolase family 3 N-terminal domain-containing protein [Enterococcus lemanii]